MCMWPEDGTGGWHAFLSVQLFLSLYENRSSQSKDSFPFFTSLHLFFLFLHSLQSHSISPVARPRFFASQEVLSIIFFYTICCHHLSSSAPFLTQSIQTFPKISQKIPPILPRWWNMCSPLAVHCPALRGWGKHHPPLNLSSSIVLWGGVQQTRSCYKGEKKCKGRILLVLFMGKFSVEWG